MNIRYVFFILLMLMPALAQAEGGCPPGSYPQQGQGWQTCVPIPGSQPIRPAAPSEQWEDRWGSIAQTADGQISGAAENQKTESDATNAAIADCQNSRSAPCKSLGTYRNQCLTIVAGSNGTKIEVARDEMEATQKALKACTGAKQEGCHVYYAACSLPVRTR